MPSGRLRSRAAPRRAIPPSTATGDRPDDASADLGATGEVGRGRGATPGTGILPAPSGEVLLAFPLSLVARRATRPKRSAAMPISVRRWGYHLVAWRPRA